MFKVGETVILQSKELPQYNGVHVVRARVEVGEVFHDRASDTIWENGSDSVGYVLEELLISEGQEAFWNQSALRKYHEPSDMSFQELMKEFKKPLALS